MSPALVGIQVSACKRLTIFGTPHGIIKQEYEDIAQAGSLHNRLEVSACRWTVMLPCHQSLPPNVNNSFCGERRRYTFPLPRCLAYESTRTVSIGSRCSSGTSTCHCSPRCTISTGEPSLNKRALVIESGTSLSVTQSLVLFNTCT